MPEVGDTLSEREMEVLRLVATGATNDQIARDLVISINTVKVHVRNIFTKLGVASRTEAVLHAVRQGWVVVETPETGETEQGITTRDVTPPDTVRRWPRVVMLASTTMVIVLVIVLSLTIVPDYILPQPTSIFPITPIPPAGWVPHSPMSQARSDVTVVPFLDELYVIGGEDLDGVSGATERYNPRSDEWTALADKPTAVAGARGAALGGRIYLPGGRDARGRPVSVHESYEVELNRWLSVAPLPRPLAGYALVAFEGRLLLFGGWDGDSYRSEVLQYSPDLDRWEVILQLPYPWGYGDAVVATDRILLIGGGNAVGPVNAILEYSPTFSTDGPQPLTMVSLGRVQVTILARVWLFVLTESEDVSSWQLWKHYIGTKKWELLQPPPEGYLPGMTLTGMETELFIVGGREETSFSPLIQTFKAVYYAVPR